MLYKVLGARTKSYFTDEYYYNKSRFRYFGNMNSGYEIYLEDVNKAIYVLSMQVCKKIYYGEVNKVFNEIGDYPHYSKKEIEIYSTYGIYTIQEANRDILKGIKQVVKDKSDNNDLVWINEGADIKNHLFTCVKYSGDSWFSKGEAYLHWNNWEYTK